MTLDLLQFPQVLDLIWYDDPYSVTEIQVEEWVKADSWDICDQCCSNLFDKTKYAYKKAIYWSGRNEQYIKRAGFVLMATLAVHDKSADDKTFLKFLTLIKEHSTDERNYVKPSKSARWIASDALRELTSNSIQTRLGLQSK